MIIRRPKPEDNENDLLEFQKQFLASGQQPSAKVIKCIPKSNEGCNLKSTPKQTVDSTSNLSTKIPTALSASKCDNDNIEEEMDHYDTHITKVLSNIIKEKEVIGKPSFPSFRSLANPQAVPCNFNRGHVHKKLKKRSLFSQQFGKQNQTTTNAFKNEHQSALSNSTCTSQSDLNQIFPSSKLIVGNELKSCVEQSNDLIQSIHEENITKLSQMSSSEIFLEQKKLKENLDTKVLEFFSKKKQNNILSATTKMDVQEKPSSLDTIHVKENWMHMNEIEVEKINWTKSIPKTASENLDFPNRFDFDGSLLSLEDSMNIPSYVGLHHHGNEPDMAGYTLQELVSLARSQFLQQQIFALKMLAKIIDKDKFGKYYAVTHRWITPVLLEAGLAFILRWALDSRSDNCVQAGVEAIHSLLHPCDFQLYYLNEHLLSYRGCEFPSFQPAANALDAAAKESDHELVSRDLVKGLLQMDILYRLRYIVEVCKPSQTTLCQCLEILHRICQHSMDSAIKVLECPRLMQFIVDSYLPVVWPSDCSGDQQKQFSFPIHQAVILVRLLCQAGRHTASRLIHDYPRIREFITKTITLVYTDISEEFHFLKLETWRLWIVVASYGFCLDLCRDLWPSLMRMLQGFVRRIQENDNLKTTEEIEVAMKFISTAVKAPSSEETSNVFLDHNEANGFCSIALAIAKQAILFLSDMESSAMQKKFIGVISGCLNTFTSCVERGLQTLDDSIINNVLFILHSLRPLVVSSISFLQAKESISQFEILPSLPDLKLGAVSTDAGERLLFSLSRVNLMTSFFRCCAEVCRANRSSRVDFASFFEEWSVADASSSIMANLRPGFLHRSGQHCVYSLLKFFMICVVEQAHSSTNLAEYFHSLALSCVASFGPGDEQLAADLVCSALFHPDLWGDVSSIQVEDRRQPVKDILPGLRSSFVFLISINCKQLEVSKNWAHQDQLRISSFLLPRDTGPLLPSDWPFLPIIYVYDSAIHRGEAVDQSSVNFALATIKSCLSFLLFLEVNRSGFWKRLNITMKLVRLMCLYIVGSDVFLDDEIAAMMKLLFSLYCGGEQVDEIDFNQDVPGLTSFYDFYVSLLDQYESVSYGRHLFSAVILLPLAKTASSSLKLALWAEHSHALQIISLSEEQLLLPARSYFADLENDFDVIRAYARVLVAGKRCSTFLHKLAVHHVATYLFDQNHPEKFRHELMAILQACNAELREKILHHR